MKEIAFQVCGGLITVWCAWVSHEIYIIGKTISKIEAKLELT